MKISINILAKVAICFLCVASAKLSLAESPPPPPPAPPSPTPRSIGDEIREAIMEALKEEGPRVAEEVQRAMSSFSWVLGENGERPSGGGNAFMGIVTEPIPAVLRDYADIPAGVGILITHIVAGGPAENSELKRNDILLAFDDQRIMNQSQLSSLIRLQKPGDVVTLKVLRRGIEQVIPFTLGERRAPGGRWKVVGEHAPRAMEIAQEHFPDIALKVLDGVDQWIPGSVRIVVDDEQKIEVDLKDLQVNLMELREKLDGMRAQSEESGVSTIRDTEGRTTRIFVGDSSFTYADDNGRLRMEYRDGREYFWFWKGEDNFLIEGYLDDILPELNDNATQLLKRFQDSREKMNWDKDGRDVEVEMVVPDGEPDSQ